MPELPEVESVRRVLLNRLSGLSVKSVEVIRSDVIKQIRRPRSSCRPKIDQLQLLVGGSFSDIIRHGKRLALVVRDGRVLEFGLGMSGLLRFEEPGSRGTCEPHEHVSWDLEGARGVRGGKLIWKDPRRFGSITPVDSPEALMQLQWGHLGPVALQIGESEFVSRLRAGRSAIKVRLLNQRVVAGIGNIYADEALFQAGIRPGRPANRTSAARLAKLRLVTIEILRQAICAGGSSIRTHQDPEGRSGRFQEAHAVYGRLDEPCVLCGEAIRGGVLGGRTTVWCVRCQK